jgi:MFS superfamily sulfate permease-like transporter
MTQTNFSPNIALRLDSSLRLVQKQYWREDLMAGLSVTMVSIPLNLALALGSGVPPEVHAGC